VETEFGRKTRIHQSSCNKDFSCLEGDCPSFLTVVPAERRPAPIPAPPRVGEPEPLVAPDDFTLRMMGIGGTGVVTISQVVGTAALIDGLHVAELDQTGLSQKGGPVSSDMRISRRPAAGSNRLSSAGADLYLGFDVLGASSPRNLAVADPERTVAVVSTTAVPTGAMVVDATQELPRLDDQLVAIASSTRSELNVYLDAQGLAERLLGDHMPANMLALGAAWQRGALPLSASALEQAIRLNGAAVEKNLAAFGWGRAWVAAPEAVEAAVREPEPPAPSLSPAALELIERVEGGPELPPHGQPVARGGELRRLLDIRVPDLIAYQGRAYAAEYADFVAGVRHAEQERTPGSPAVTEAVARQLHKLMAYKDEYEVARLHLAALPADGRFWIHLHPPLLRALGLKRKLKLGRWFVPVLRLLRATRGLRGTPLDPFGRARVRRVERALPGEYRALVTGALDHLSPANAALVLELCELPDEIRGYEAIKLRSVARFRTKAERLSRRIERPPAAHAAAA
jgi:indolepyruvate ferredoxin oxidoreductase